MSSILLLCLILYLNFFQSQNTLDIYFHASTFKKGYKWTNVHLIYVRVFILVVTFFKMMDMNDYEKYLETEEKFQGQRTYM